MLQIFFRVAVEFIVVEVRRREGAAAKWAIEEMVLRVVVGLASFHNNLAVCAKEHQRTHNGVDRPPHQFPPRALRIQHSGFCDLLDLSHSAHCNI